MFESYRVYEFTVDGFSAVHFPSSVKDSSAHLVKETGNVENKISRYF